MDWLDIIQIERETKSKEYLRTLMLCASPKQSAYIAMAMIIISNGVHTLFMLIESGLDNDKAFKLMNRIDTVCKLAEYLDFKFDVEESELRSIVEALTQMDMERKVHNGI